MASLPTAAILGVSEAQCASETEGAPRGRQWVVNDPARGEPEPKAEAMVSGGVWWG